MNKLMSILSTCFVVHRCSRSCSKIQKFRFLRKKKAQQNDVALGCVHFVTFSICWFSMRTIFIDIHDVRFPAFSISQNPRWMRTRFLLGIIQAKPKMKKKWKDKINETKSYIEKATKSSSSSYRLLSRVDFCRVYELKKKHKNNVILMR